MKLPSIILTNAIAFAMGSPETLPLFDPLDKDHGLTIGQIAARIAGVQGRNVGIEIRFDYPSEAPGGSPRSIGFLLNCNLDNGIYSFIRPVI